MIWKLLYGVLVVLINICDSENVLLQIYLDNYHNLIEFKIQSSVNWQSICSTENLLSYFTKPELFLGKVKINFFFTLLSRIWGILYFYITTKFVNVDIVRANLLYARASDWKNSKMWLQSKKMLILKKLNCLLAL